MEGNIMDGLFIIPFLSSPSIQLDGALTEDAYKQAAVIDTLIPVYPESGTPFPFELYLFHDGKNLYVGGYVVNPYGIHAQETSRDARMNVMDDMVQLVLSSGDRGYVFGLYPLGTQVDNLISNYNRWSIKWDFDWKSASRFSDTLWTFEMVIPIYRLDLSDTARLNVNVINILPQEMGWFQILATYPVPADQMEDIRNSMGIVFENGITFERGRPRITFSPYVVSVHASPSENIPYFRMGNTSIFYRVGADVEMRTERWGVAAAILPDYSQVEADVAQLNLSRASMLYLPEKRPFFQEKLEIFEKTLLDIFYTRSIGDMNGGVKAFYESETWKTQGFYINEDGGRHYAGFGTGFQRGGFFLSPYAISYGDSAVSTSVASLYGRLYRKGLVLSGQGVYQNTGAWAGGMSLSYNRMGLGGFSISTTAYSKDFSFPTTYLAYRPGLFTYRFGVWFNRLRKSPIMYMTNLWFNYSHRNEMDTGLFFSEYMSMGISAGVYRGLMLTTWMDRNSSVLVSYRFYGAGITIGSTTYRMLMLSAMYGDYGGLPSRGYRIEASYTLGRLSITSFLDAISPQGAPTMATINGRVSFRTASGFYMNAFYQKTLNNPYYPEEEFQTVLGYEWGGRSRVYLVVHPYVNGGTLFDRKFFKIAYSFYF